MRNRSRNSSNSAKRTKAKKTFTLSREAVNFLEAERLRYGRQKSASLILEEIIRERRMRARTKNSDVAISAYYDALSDEEREENKRWGEFAESQFPLD